MFSFIVAEKWVRLNCICGSFGEDAYNCPLGEWMDFTKHEK